MPRRPMRVPLRKLGLAKGLQMAADLPDHRLRSQRPGRAKIHPVQVKLPADPGPEIQSTFFYGRDARTNA